MLLQKQTGLFLIFLILALHLCAVSLLAQDGGTSELDEGVISQREAPVVVENLRAFAKMYGYIRYFHPSDAASAIDWNRFAIYGAAQVQSATSQGELKETLQTLFYPIAPTAQIYSAGDSIPTPHPLLSPVDTAGLELVAWQHKGVDLGDSQETQYRSIRLNRKIMVGGGGRAASFDRNIDATPYRGKDIKMTASVKTEVSGSGNHAGLSLVVVRTGNRYGFYDDMRDRRIAAPEWNNYEIVGPVAEDADRIEFGGFMRGNGTAWFDDMALFVRDNPDEEWEALSLENLGFEEGANGDSPLGWTVWADNYYCATTDEEYSAGSQALVITSSLTLQRTQPLFDKRPTAGEVVERPLGGDLFVQIPLALYSKDGQTLRPENAPALSQLEDPLEAILFEELSAADTAFRYADVIIAWNVFQHFYPYFDVIEADWDTVLTQSLRRASEDEATQDFLNTLRWMTAQLEDGHVRVTHPSIANQVQLPFIVDRIEDEVVIVALADSLRKEPCFKLGDVVRSIDGIPSNQVLNEALQYISGSSQWKLVRALREFVRGERGTQAHLELDRGGQAASCVVTREYEGQLYEERPAPIEVIREGIYYVDLSRAEMAAIENEAEALAVAKGVIFDLRGYPNGNNGTVPAYLSEDALQLPRFQEPLQIYPDQLLVEYDTTGRGLLAPREPRFTGKIVFLTDERAISYAEMVMGIVEHYKLGEIVGRTTAGANGTVNTLVLPGEYSIRWTGMRVLKHDGSQHHLIGIQPTVPVKKSLQGIREGRDEDLEKALELIGRSEGR